MRPLPATPQPGPPRLPAPRIGATLPLRVLGACLLALAITVPGCQALLYGATPPVVHSDVHHGHETRAGLAGDAATGADHPDR